MNPSDWYGGNAPTNMNYANFYEADYWQPPFNSSQMTGLSSPESSAYSTWLQDPFAGNPESPLPPQPVKAPVTAQTKTKFVSSLPLPTLNKEVKTAQLICNLPTTNVSGSFMNLKEVTSITSISLSALRNSEYYVTDYYYQQQAHTNSFPPESFDIFALVKNAKLAGVQCLPLARPLHHNQAWAALPCADTTGNVAVPIDSSRCPVSTNQFATSVLLQNPQVNQTIAENKIIELTNLAINPATVPNISTFRIKTVTEVSLPPGIVEANSNAVKAIVTPKNDVSSQEEPTELFGRTATAKYYSMPACNSIPVPADCLLSQCVSIIEGRAHSSLYNVVIQDLNIFLRDTLRLMKRHNDLFKTSLAVALKQSTTDAEVQSVITESDALFGKVFQDGQSPVINGKYSIVTSHRILVALYYRQFIIYQAALCKLIGVPSVISTLIKDRSFSLIFHVFEGINDFTYLIDTLSNEHVLKSFIQTIRPDSEGTRFINFFCESLINADRCDSMPLIIQTLAKNSTLAAIIYSSMGSKFIAALIKSRFTSPPEKDYLINQLRPYILEGRASDIILTVAESRQPECLMLIRNLLESIDQESIHRDQKLMQTSVIVYSMSSPRQ